MFRINVENDTICLKTINKNSFKKILDWYNDLDEYKLATGIDKRVTPYDLLNKLEETFVSDSEFVIEIILKSTRTCIGVIRGGLNNKIQNALWINSIIIDKNYQRLGYGTQAINLITNYFYGKYIINNTYISVVDKNTKARNFWSKLGYKVIRRMNNHLVLDNEVQNVLIMGKQLNKYKLSS